MKKTITVVAVVENLETVQAGLPELLEGTDCSPKTEYQLEVAVEEIFVNICSYAYPPGSGTAVVTMELLEDPKAVRITFEDNGVPFDPLAREQADPAAVLADETRQGGLGLFLVQKSMDEMFYEYRDGKNCLTILKKL